MLEGRGVPRSGDSVLRDGDEIGTITSGTWSPTLNRGIGMAYIVPDFTMVGVDVEIASKGRVEKGHVTSLPFYSRGK
jgi:aminomethyltransferase